jgi:hypothetical protein
MPKYPTIRDVAESLRLVKHYVPYATAPDASDYREEDGDPPSIQVTLGYTPEDGSWSLQSGDNSFTGCAYGHPIWAVGYITRRTNCRKLAAELVDQLDEQVER